MNVVYDIPLVQRDGSVIKNKKKFNIFYLEDLVLFEFFYQIDSSLNGKVILNEYRSQYFVFKRNAKSGIMYNPADPKKNKKQLSVDSLLRKNALQEMKWDIIAQYKPGVRQYNNDNGILEEVYGSNDIKKGDESQDTLRFYYTNNLKDFDFSFSKRLDSIHKMKLFKIKLQYSQVYNKDHQITFPKRETNFEMHELKDFQQDRIFKFFQEYRKDYDILKL